MPLRHQLAKIYRTYERWVPLIFFLLGVLFDIVTLSAIDDPLSIGQQILYLFLIAGILTLELLNEVTPFRFGPKTQKIWAYREAILHFILGSLLSVYSLFYFKSAAVLTSFIFVGVLAILLTVNEFMRFGQSQKAVHTALFSLCLISFFVYIVPIILGFVGIVPFLGAIFVSFLTITPLYRFLKKKLGPAFLHVRHHIVLPFLGMHLVFAALYFGKIIPPVPISTSYIGIFHQVEKKGTVYEVSHEKPWWKVWETGDQTFYARPSDKIFCFVRLFSPTGFKDDLTVRWLYKDKRGWQPADAIPLSITGGRKEGYRAVTYKSNYQPGKWRVQIETTDGREVSRLNFRVLTDSTENLREFAVETH